MKKDKATEYRVKWKREGLKAKIKVFQTRAAAERRLTLLGPEPWKAMGREPESKWCCSGYQCACGGVTVREESENTRKTMPRLEYVQLEKRQVQMWQKD